MKNITQKFAGMKKRRTFASLLRTRASGVQLSWFRASALQAEGRRFESVNAHRRWFSFRGSSFFVWYLLVSVAVRVSGISGLVRMCSWKCSRGFPSSRVAWSSGVCRGLLIFFFIALVWLGVCSFLRSGCLVFVLFMLFVFCGGGCFLGLCVYI